LSQAGRELKTETTKNLSVLATRARPATMANCPPL